MDDRKILKRLVLELARDAKPAMVYMSPGIRSVLNDALGERLVRSNGLTYTLTSAGKRVLTQLGGEL